MKAKIHVVVALAAMIGGCSSGNADAFVGSYVYTGVIAPNCAGVTLEALDLTGVIVDVTKKDDEHVQVMLGSMCTITFTVDGNRASADSGQACLFDIPTVGPSSVAITSWTLTLADGGGLASQFNGSVVVCAPSGAGTLTRLGDAGT